MDPPKPSNHFKDYSAKGYALSGKIMLTAIVVVFFVAIVMVSLHLYARWYLLNSRRRRARHRRRSHLVFFVDPSNPDRSAPVTVSSSGLDAAVLKTLPLFVYSSDTHPDLTECAVCLSEFEENESGRILPKCNHSFHVECIDMWFHSHSTCPLCRSPVEPVVPKKPGNEIGSTSSGLRHTCQHKDDASTSSFNGTGKPSEFIGITVEVPRRNGHFGGDSATESPSSYRSPISRMLSFKRILSREKRGNAASPQHSGESRNESDTEKAGVETIQSQHGKLGGDSVV